MRKPHKLMTDQQIEKAFRARNAGMTLEEIGRAFDVSPAQVFNKTEAMRKRTGQIAAQAAHKRRQGVPVMVVDTPKPQTRISDLCKPISGKATASFSAWGNLSMGNIGRGE